MTKSASIPGLINIRELASWLRLSQRTVWRLLKKNSLPQPIHVGRSIRWSTDQIAGWLAAGKMPANC